jgi:uncharacterized protein
MRFLAALICSTICLHAVDWNAQALIELSASPNAKLRPVPVRAVKLTGGFWKARQDVTIRTSIPTLLPLLEEHGVVDNFRRISDPSNYTARHGWLFTDSDLYKWVEAAAWSLQDRPDPALEAIIDSYVDEILAVQEPSGYLNTYFQDDRRKDRFQKMPSGHELYCLGHMLQAGIAYYRATGKSKLMNGGMKFADYLATDFGPAPKPPILTGHPELELALVELYRTTGKKSYLELAGYLLSGVERDRLKLTDSQVAYMFSGVPFTSRTKYEGHAVRAMYASTGASDYWLETGDPKYLETLNRLWADLTTSKMFITGGVGSRSSGEAFGEPYELPNREAYTESCAAIGNLIFNQRLLAGSGDAKYADVMERALYNGINSGMSVSGTLYCYRNPLATDGEQIRNEWYDVTCCPPNIQRTLAALTGYFYSTSRDGLWVHFYDGNNLDWHLESGMPLKVSMRSGMPWQGDAELLLDPAHAAEFTLHLRIPSWSTETKVLVNGQPAGVTAQPNTYLALTRTWKPGDRVSLQFDMRPKLVRANERISENHGKAAVQRGPLVYCLEQVDLEGASVYDVSLMAAQKFEAEWRPDLMGGVTVLKHKGAAAQKPSAFEELYSFVEQGSNRPVKPVDLTLVPYYTFHNRGAAPMTVWIPLN